MVWSRPSVVSCLLGTEHSKKEKIKATQKAQRRSHCKGVEEASWENLLAPAGTETQKPREAVHCVYKSHDRGRAEAPSETREFMSAFNILFCIFYNEYYVSS